MILTTINADGNKRTFSNLAGKKAFRVLTSYSSAEPEIFGSFEDVYKDVDAMKAIVRENLDEHSVCSLDDA